MTEPRPAAAAAKPAGWLNGTDPAGWADTAGETDPFPPVLELDVEPADGGPWADASLLGDGDTPGSADRTTDRTADPGTDPPTDPPEALRADLAAAHGDPQAGWVALHASDDPAVRALAARWHR
jgi:hypothetical protein